ncbi:MAG: hypothetical protein IKF64_06305, partial [Eubacterium sp.]|nr:hypothetical protein [Eubacterium sp.]
MKSAGIAAIILSTTSAGFILYDNSRRRLCVFRELVILCDALKRDFMCRRTPINELLGELITTSELRHLNFIKAHSDDGLKAADSPLKKAQNTELNMFLRSLG